MATDARGKKTIGVVVGLIAGGFLIRYWIGGGRENEIASEMQDIRNQVAVDAIEEYQIARRQGDLMQICVKAGEVSAAYLQAQNELSHKQWKKTEDEDCKRAGLSAPEAASQ